MDTVKTVELKRAPKTSTPVPTSLVLYCALLEHYQICDVARVTAFIDIHPELYPLLINSAKAANFHFEYPQLFLSLGYFSDQDPHDFGVWVDIRKDLPEESLQQAQMCFDCNWWFPAQQYYKCATFVNFAVSVLTPGAGGV